MDEGFVYASMEGLCLESDYPYTASDGTCRKNSCNSTIEVKYHENVKSNDEYSLLMAVQRQPISIAIEADHKSFQFYSSGVYNSTDCGYELDHGVLVVGWGVLDGQEYWKVKNSWGPSWGNDGYIYLARNIKDKRGQCGIAMQPSYPVV